MCTCVIAVGARPAWPILLAANRDERLDRPARDPARHWPHQPDVIGGLDVLAGGTWLALNAAGVVAAALNREGTLGPQAGKRSRGELPLLALRHATAADAAHAIAGLDGSAWRCFNLLIAAADGAFLLTGKGESRIAHVPLAPGVHMITARDLDDETCPRIARNLPRFRAAETPDPPDWSAWAAILADTGGAPRSAINILPVNGFGTVSSSLIAISGGGEMEFRHAAGPPSAASFAPVPRETPPSSTRHSVALQEKEGVLF